MKRQRFGFLFPVALCLIVPALAGCCMGPALPLAQSWGEVASDETVVVGRIEISPPLDDGEQTLKTVQGTSGGCLINPTAGYYTNKVILLTNTKMKKFTEDPSMGDYANRMEVPIGETFYVRAPNTNPLYVVRSEILMSIHGGGTEKALLPSGYKMNIHRGDRAIYIGTIRYYRDEFFTVKRVEVIDNYERESAAFRKKFGSKVQLRKALMEK